MSMRIKSRAIDFVTVACLIYYYDATSSDIYDIQNRTLDFKKNQETGKNEYIIKSDILNKELLDEALNWYYEGHHNIYGIYELNFLLDRIDLLGRFVMN